MHLAAAWLILTTSSPFTVARRSVHGRLTGIEQVTGAYLLGGVPRSGSAITVTGYAAGSDDNVVEQQS